MLPLGWYGWAYGKAIPAELDHLDLHFKDPASGAKINWSMLNLNLVIADPDSYFRSQLVTDLYGSQTDKFMAKSFHFHRTSEHIINGNDIDLELHISQPATPAPKSIEEFLVAPVGIFFSVENFDAAVSQTTKSVIWNFFDNLQFGA